MKSVLIMIVAFSFVLLFISCDKTSTKTDDDGIVDADTGLIDSDGVDEDIVDPDEVTDGDEVTDDDVVCKIPDTIVTPVDGYTSYFAFNGIGTINPADIFDTARPESTMLEKVAIKLEDDSERVLSDSWTFFIDSPADTETGSTASIGLYALGDPVGTSYTTMIYTSMPIQWIDVLKEQGVTEGSFSTMVQVMGFRDVGNDISETCILAVSDFAEVDGSSLPAGKLGVCYDKNESFAAGEIFRFGVNAKLTVDKQAMVDMFTDIETIDDLCWCNDADNNKVACPVEATDDDVVDEDITDSDTNDVETDADVDNYINPCTPTNTCVEAHQTVCTDANTDGVAECACDADYHFNGSNVCISNTKTESCVDNAPANATSTVADVDVTWNGTGWNTAADCAWTCDDGYTINNTSDGCDQNPI